MADEKTRPHRKYVSLIIRIVIAVLACWLTFRNFDIHTLHKLNKGTLALAVFVFCISLVLIGIRWWLFVRAQQIKIPLFLAIKLSFLGQFFTNFMPSAVGGDLVRAWYISRHTHKKIQAALGVLADRMMGLLSMTILAVAAYLLFMGRRTDILQAVIQKSDRADSVLKNIAFSWPKALLVLVILTGLVFVLSDYFDLKGIAARFFSVIFRFFCKFKEVLLVYFRHLWLLFFSIGVTILFQISVILSLWLIGRNLGMTCGIEYYFVFFPLMWVISSLPLSIAGIGILEGGLVLLFHQIAHADPQDAAALALCQRCIWIISSLPGLWVHLTGGHRHKEPLC